MPTERKGGDLYYLVAVEIGMQRCEGEPSGRAAFADHGARGQHESSAGQGDRPSENAGYVKLGVMPDRSAERSAPSRRQGRPGVGCVWDLAAGFEKIGACRVTCSCVHFSVRPKHRETQG